MESVSYTHLDVYKRQVDGTLLGHLVMGALEVEKAAQALGTSHETAVLLQHLLLSHHGVPEFGCAVRPMCLEAELLSMLDHLDATVNQIAGATAHVEQGKFSEKLWALDQRRFYPVSYTHLDVYKRQRLGCKTVAGTANAYGGRKSALLFKRHGAKCGKWCAGKIDHPLVFSGAIDKKMGQFLSLIHI